MPQFQYTAADSTGKKITKIMVAANREEVADFLKKSQLVAIKVENISDKAIKQSRHLSLADKVVFTQDISVLLQAGISLGEALRIIAEDASKTTGAFYSAIRDELEKGNTLSVALNQFPQTFDSLYISLVKAGETSGELSTIMQNLATSLERDGQTRNQVRGALIYPAFIFTSLIGLGLMIIFFVLPRVTKVFTELNVKLPFTTQLMVNTANLINKYPIQIIVGLVILIGGLVFYFRTAHGKKTLTWVAYKLPFVKEILINTDLLHLSSVLSLLLNAGVPIQEAIVTASATIADVRLSQELQETAKQLANGKALAESLRLTSLPKTFVALIAAGERSGNISSVLKTLADHYGQVLETAIKNFTGIIEPVLTMVVGLIVGVVVISVMLPIYSFVGNLQNVK